jgi:hypothetical protein
MRHASRRQRHSRHALAQCNAVGSRRGGVACQARHGLAQAATSRAARHPNSVATHANKKRRLTKDRQRKGLEHLDDKG